MSDPATLRRQADQLREAARGMRSKARSMDDTLVSVQQAYPAGRDGVWVGAHADRFYEELHDAKSELSRIQGDVDDYADECERKARLLDQEAEGLEAEQPSG